MTMTQMTILPKLHLSTSPEPIMYVVGPNIFPLADSLKHSWLRWHHWQGQHKTRPLNQRTQNLPRSNWGISSSIQGQSQNTAYHQISHTNNTNKQLWHQHFGRWSPGSQWHHDISKEHLQLCSTNNVLSHGWIVDAIQWFCGGSWIW